MTTKARKVFGDALKLSQKDRAKLAARLLDSLDTDKADEIEAAWAAEIEKRIEELESGKVKAIPWSVAWKEIVERAHAKSRVSRPSRS
jgi:putative addiction module component (TIGR02574 family)